jgi:hypothetical protein
MRGPPRAGSELLVAGKPRVYPGKRSRPTMTIYSPEEATRPLRSWCFPAGAIRFWAVVCYNHGS